MNTASAPVYEFAGFRIDTAKRLLTRRDGSVLPLTPRVFETLLYLVEHSGEVLERQRLMDAVWPDAVVEENNLTQNISILRRVLGQERGSNEFIVTAPGRGYRFVPEVKQAENGAALSGTSPRSDQVPQIVEGEPPENLWPQDAAALGRLKLRSLLLAAAGILLLALVGFALWSRQASTPVAAALSTAPEALRISEKSIAVLPFTNLSDEKENAYFAAGLQDDVLSTLSKIRELKVISRTSVMSYEKPEGRNMREIGQALGAANVLEGSVRRAGNRVLVNIQLIDARSDLHIWSERYDRTLADSIGLQGELATQIAAALRAQLAPTEKTNLETRPTENPEAYALYLQGRGQEGAVNRSKANRVAAVQWYTGAIALDPGFALAYARRSIVTSELAYDAGADALRVEARSDAEEALRLSPSLGEAHTALGISLYKSSKDFAAALREFSIAAATSPNEPDILVKMAAVYRRQGRWDEALAASQRAAGLDPRNGDVLIRAANGRALVRDWSGARAGFNRAQNIVPDSAYPEIALAYLEVFQNNDPAAGRKILQSIPAHSNPDGEVSSARWDLAMLQRDYVAAEKILADFTGLNFPNEEAHPKTFHQGRTALARGDVESAERYFRATLPALDGHVREDPGDLDWRASLGLLYAYMQRKDDALREGRRAVEMEPESRNAYHGAFRAAKLALIYALVGEQEHAITLIERLLTTPGPVQWPDYPMSMTLADLRLRWEWDSLRSHPRFQKILAGPEPKTILASTVPVTHEKSIAVLPFANLSGDPENAYFADGVKEE
ncbi:MAG: winged helix-turn-helix domain-containing protein, partial [Chthoniobacterales bacterium]